ncbi:MAG: RDD family protein [Campylobacter sp.]|uniref:RDD family protein n=1 Tax=Campylobacter sp. TaxID=205 RepID=UPI002976C533|nr:RDD family protein [Campylobacter sp.]MDD7600536.1 RDD family protein [Campylobacteraceae bacterium]MDY5887643.1 RDD family protein [Campylobacter sp.]
MESISERLERENIRLASFDKRLFAHLIDEVIISALFFVIYYDAFKNAAGDVQAMIAVISSFIWQLMLLKVLYHTFFVWRYGASLGKIVMGIMVLDSEILDFPSLPKALIRACVRIISEWCFYLGFIWMLGNAANQSWHDKLSGTIVCENK